MARGRRGLEKPGPPRGAVAGAESGRPDLAGRPPPQRRWRYSFLSANLQLTANAYGYATLFGKLPSAIRLVSLVKTKQPKIESQETDRDGRDYARLFNVAKEVIEGVRAGVFVTNRGCWLCGDCEFDADCREWTGNEDWFFSAGVT